MIFSLMHISHVVFVILWIGGLGFVTMMVLPAVIKNPNALEKVLQFQRIEHRFAPVAKLYNLIVGVSGFYMLFYMGSESLLFTREGASLTFMTVVWVFWAVMLFGLEPLVIKKLLERMIRGNEEMDIDSIFAKVAKLHWVLLFISLAACGAGVVFAHGYTL